METTHPKSRSDYISLPGSRSGSVESDLLQPDTPPSCSALRIASKIKIIVPVVTGAASIIAGIIISATSDDPDSNITIGLWAAGLTSFALSYGIYKREASQAPANDDSESESDAIGLSNANATVTIYTELGNEPQTE